MYGVTREHPRGIYRRVTVNTISTVIVNFYCYHAAIGSRSNADERGGDEGNHRLDGLIYNKGLVELFTLSAHWLHRSTLHLLRSCNDIITRSKKKKRKKDD